MGEPTCPAVVFAGREKVDIRNVIIPHVEDEEILVRSLCTGISVGTERWYLTGKVKGVDDRYPLIPGYMRVGIVEETGSNVDRVKPGDRVYLGSWAMRLDPRDGLSGGGAHSAHAVTHQSRAIPVPDNVASEEAAVAALAAVSQVGLSLTPVNAGDLVVVIGQGMVGQMSAQLARLMGANVITSDLIDLRVDLSRKHSADFAINPAREDLGTLVRQHCADGADLVIDTSGDSRLFGYDVDLLRKPGKLCLQGYFPDPIHVDFHDTHLKRTVVAFPWGFDPEGVERAFHFLGEKRLTISPLITHRIDSRDATDAYRLLLERPQEMLGVVLNWS